MTPLSMVLLLPRWEKELEDEGEHKNPSSASLSFGTFSQREKEIRY
ncbi:hypothetical protein J7K99_05865 [bacterium]|nr:hypothetical protein [bacterium]